MAVLASATGFSSGDFLSSSHIRPAAFVQPAIGPSPNRSDLKAAAIESLMGALNSAENTLLDWVKDPSILDDDDTNAPSRDTIRHAMNLLQQIKGSLNTVTNDVSLLPLRGLTIGSGGSISLEFAHGVLAVAFIVRPDGLVEHLTFVDNGLRQRYFLCPGQPALPEPARESGFNLTSTLVSALTRGLWGGEHDISSSETAFNSLSINRHMAWP